MKVTFFNEYLKNLKPASLTVVPLCIELGGNRNLRASFVESLPEGDGKQAILFCTYRLWKGRTFSKLKKELKKKGYDNILCVSTKGREFTKEDFSDETTKIAEALKE